MFQALWSPLGNFSKVGISVLQIRKPRSKEGDSAKPGIQSTRCWTTPQSRVTPKLDPFHQSPCPSFTLAPWAGKCRGRGSLHDPLAARPAPPGCPLRPCCRARADACQDTQWPPQERVPGCRGGTSRRESPVHRLPLMEMRDKRLDLHPADPPGQARCYGDRPALRAWTGLPNSRPAPPPPPPRASPQRAPLPDPQGTPLWCPPGGRVSRPTCCGMLINKVT